MNFGRKKFLTSEAIKHDYLFDHLEEVVGRDCRSYQNHQTFVTEKGLEYIIERLIKENS